jgi:hypothetical protein
MAWKKYLLENLISIYQKAEDNVQDRIKDKGPILYTDWSWKINP